MRTYNDNASITDFDFWSGAKSHKFTYSELKELDFHIEELYPEGISQIQLNDLFWFEDEFLCGCIGIDFQEYLER